MIMTPGESKEITQKPSGQLAVGIDGNTTNVLDITVEFSGGLEMLFSDQRIHSVKLPARDGNGRPASLALLIRHLVDHSMTDSRQQLFVLDGHLRPGILVLINDSDWELQGEESYELQSRDNVLFVSTLHGG